MPTARVPVVGVDAVAVLDVAARREVTLLVDAAEEADGYPSLSDHALLAVHEEATGTAGVRGVVLLLARCRGTGTLAGCAVVEHRGEAWTVEMAVHPAHRRETDSSSELDPASELDFSTELDGATVTAAERSTASREDVERALLDAALAHATSRGGGTFRVWARNAHQRIPAGIAERGFEKTRELLQLRASLPPDAAGDGASPPVPVRPFRPGRDEEAWLEVNRRAFAGHPEQASWDVDELVRREREPWFDPHGFLLHEVDGRIAAFCWTKVHRAPVLGEIYVIGVDPDFQGRGLGRALARAGLGHLAARGISTAMLYVEAANTPALVLYRTLGFAEHHREALFTGDTGSLRGVPRPSLRAPARAFRCRDQSLRRPPGRSRR